MPKTQINTLRAQAGHIAELARLLPMWPSELADSSISGRQRRIRVLRRALRLERQRGIAGHWTYDLSRHSSLLECYRTETAGLEEQLGGRATANGRPSGSKRAEPEPI